MGAGVLAAALAVAFAGACVCAGPGAVAAVAAQQQEQRVAERQQLALAIAFHANEADDFAGADFQGHTIQDLEPTVIERLEVPPEDAAYVGDQTPDMECASAAGIPLVIGLAHARGADTLAAAGATYVATTLAEVEAMLLRGDTICA